MRGPPSDNTSSPVQTQSQPLNGNVSQSDRGDGIENLSRLMLEGWTMLAETCPRTDCHMPLARSRQGRIYCCACQADVVAATSTGAPQTGTASRASPVVTTPRSVAENPSSLPTPDAPAAPAPNPAGTVIAVRGGTSGGAGATSTALSVSAALGEKLLQGWTMLNRSCTTCATPLLRSAAGALLCVRCASTSAAVGAGGRAAPTAPPAVPAPPPRAHLLAPPRAAGAPRPMSCALLPATPGSAAVQTPGTVPLTLAGNGEQTFAELCAAEAAVVSTMSTLRAGLANRRDVEGLTAIMRGIREAAATIEQLRKARACVIANI
eukprot:IDg2577t1